MGQCQDSLRQPEGKGFTWCVVAYFHGVNTSLPLQLVDCPRDTIQGWPHVITTEDKLVYLRTLLRVGFDWLDLGSFVSPRAVPAMADTPKVLHQLEEEAIWDQTATRALVIVANERGIRNAVEFESVSALGFPFSISPTFQERNTRADQEEAMRRLDVAANTCAQHGKDLVVYLSMGFGNPYGDDWAVKDTVAWGDRLLEAFDPSVISVADTVGMATPALVKDVFESCVSSWGHARVGAHLHMNPLDGMQKVEVAHEAGCLRFDGAIRGIGGCPMAQDDLVGNAPTERLVEWAEQRGLWKLGSSRALDQAQSLAVDLFG